MDRRVMLQWMVTTGGLAALNHLSANELATLGEETHARLREGSVRTASLPSTDASLLELAAESIIPRTTTPGATDAKVVDFMQVMLDEWYTPEERDRLLTGVKLLQTESVNRYQKSFAALTSDQRTEIVRYFDQEVAEQRKRDPNVSYTHWFSMLKYLTVWGYCTSEVAMREVFHSFPRAPKYDAFAPVR